MPRPIGVDLRERAVRADESGAGTFIEVAAQFGVCRKTLQTWVSTKRGEGQSDRTSNSSAEACLEVGHAGLEALTPPPRQRRLSEHSDGGPGR